MKQIPLAIVPEPLPTFDTYVPGVNVAAVAHLRALAAGAPPVYLWGPAGSGKSHLLRALAHRHQQRGETIGSFDAADPAPWVFQPHWTLVALDRCEALDAQRQHAAFALFVHATEAGASWVAAGRLPPVDLGLRDDLRTRLAWGHVFALQPAAEHEVRAALRREADRRGILLGDEVIDYLLRRTARDLGSLMQLLERVDHFALAQKRTVTLPLLRQMLQLSGVDQAPAAPSAAGAPS